MGDGDLERRFGDPARVGEVPLKGELLSQHPEREQPGIETFAGGKLVIALPVPTFARVLSSIAR